MKSIPTVRGVGATPVALPLRPGMPAVFYSPHPDDETLSMGSAIVDAIETGTRLHVVLMSHGISAGAFDRVNNRLVWDGRPPVSREEFGLARVREFRDACGALGIPAGNVHVEHLDGGYTPASAAALMARYAAAYPTAMHATMSWTDHLGEHAYCGAALRGLAQRKAVADAVWCISRLYWTDPGLRGALDPQILEPRGPATVAKVRTAADRYALWRPDDGRYAVGMASVGDQFHRLRGDVRVLFHQDGTAR